MNDIHLPWERLENLYSATVESLLESRLALGDEHRAQTLRFAVGRLAEGRGIAEFFLSRSNSGGTVLDLGAGDGGTSLGIANYRRFSVLATDLQPNPRLNRLCDIVPLRQVAANGHRLPLADNTVDLVLCLDVIEHVPAPELLGSEIMRILKPGGTCMVTTPARLAHLFGPDPHFGIRGLLLLPDALQKQVVLRAARRKLGEVASDVYDVQHIYWSAGAVLRCFGEPGGVEILWDRPPKGLRRLFRRYLWNRLLIEKAR